MSEWLKWAKQPFASSSSSSSSSSDPSTAQRKEDEAEVKQPREKLEEDERKEPPSVTTSIPFPVARSARAPSSDAEDGSEWELTSPSTPPPLPPPSWTSHLPAIALPSLSLPSFLAASTPPPTSSASSSSSSSADPPPPPYSPPSVSSSPSTNAIPTPPASDVSYLRSLLSRWSSPSPSSPTPPTSGLTPSGLHWEKVDGVAGFALSAPRDDDGKEEKQPTLDQHRIPDEQLQRMQQMCKELQQLTPPLPSHAPSSQPPSSDSSSSASFSLSSTAHPPVIHPSLTSTSSSSSSSPSSSSSTFPSPPSCTPSDPSSLSSPPYPPLDLDELWTLVDPTRDKELAAQYNIEEGYVIVRHEDSVDGLALYLASVLHSHPVACRMGAAELRGLVERALAPVEGGGGRGWMRGYVLYGYYAYVAYSWGSTAWWLYRKPWLVQVAATGAVQAASWLLVLFL